VVGGLTPPGGFGLGQSVNGWAGNLFRTSGGPFCFWRFCAGSGREGGAWIFTVYPRNREPANRPARRFFPLRPWAGTTGAARLDYEFITWRGLA